MQSSALKQKAVVVSKAALPSACMNPPSWWRLKCHRCIRRRVISHVLHTLLHAVRQPSFFLFASIMNMDIFQISHKCGGFVSCPHPQADLAMTCRRAGHFHFFMRLPFPCLISCSLLLLVFHHVHSPITELKHLSTSHFFLPFCSSYCKSKVICVPTAFVLRRLSGDRARATCTLSSDTL